MSAKPLQAADLFCGAGGTTTGLLQAAARAGRTVDMLALNHWGIAIDTHTANHPGVRHVCESLDNVDPRKLIPGGKLDILCASPECTHHSNARGGKPRSDQSRATAWHICRWAEALRIENILIENVREFRNWGPLNKKGKPLLRKKGKTYRAFLEALRSLDYTVEDRIINAADFGDATTRHRLFIQARRSKPITWPAPSHAGNWRPAREIIDWSIRGQSLTDRKRPLSDNTMKRIAAGLVKFGGGKFLVQWDQAGGSGNCIRSVDQPLATVITKQNTGLCEPFLVKFHGNHAGREDGNNRVYSTQDPLPTLDTSNRIGLAEPFLVHLRGTSARQVADSALSIEQPVPTLTASGAHVALCQPFILHTTHHGGDRIRSIDQPLDTVTGAHRGEMALCETFVIGQQSCAAARSTGEPLPTIATAGAIALIEPFLVKYYGTGGAASVAEPLDTVTAKDRMGLVEGDWKDAVLDIRFRMLQPHELSAAMGFPADYKFSGTRENRVKQIGNAVPVNTAAALCGEFLRI